MPGFFWQAHVNGASETGCRAAACRQPGPRGNFIIETVEEGLVERFDSPLQKFATKTPG